MPFIKINSASKMFKQSEWGTKNKRSTDVPLARGATNSPAGNIRSMLNSISELQLSIGQVAQVLGKSSPQMRILNALYTKRRSIAQSISDIQVGKLKLTSKQISDIIKMAKYINNIVSNLLSEEQQDKAALSRADAGVSQILKSLGINGSSSADATSGTSSAVVPESQSTAVNTNTMAQPVAPQSQPVATQPQSRGKGWGAGIAEGVGNLAGNLLSAPGNALRGLERGWRRGRTPSATARNKRPIITASMTSAFRLVGVK